MIYAINEKTKEHQVCQNCDDADVGDVLAGRVAGETWRLVQADEDGWIRWEGDECPLPSYSKCLWKSDDGFVSNSPVHAGGMMWAQGRRAVTHYRPILEDRADQRSDEMPVKEAAPEWDGVRWPPKVGQKLECGGYIAEVIHVDGPYVVGWDASSTASGLLERQDCRPIRSEEDRAVDDMKAVAGVSYVKPEHMEMITRALYREGYRKVERRRDEKG